MSPAPPGGESARVLFVLSRDHGELFNAAYFAYGQDLDAVFAMPAALQQLNQASLPYRSHGYQRASEIHALIERERPDVVMLFSGYLLVVNKILQTEASVSMLVDALRSRGIAHATSDPSLGLMATATAESFNKRHPRHAWLVEHFARLGELFAHTTHLYLAPEGVSVSAPSLAYFNPSAAHCEASLAALRARVAQRPGMDGGRPRWLFVLSSEDHAVQSRIHGASRLAGMLADRLRDTETAGRQPVLIAPAGLLRDVGPRIADLQAPVTLPACDYTTFMELLHDAEHVFYWNMFSASILARAISAQPFFVFDKGHLSYILKPLLAKGLAHFYPGCEPQRLDFEAALDPAFLRELETEQRQRILPAIRSNLAAGQRPADVVSHLMNTSGRQ